MEAGELMTTKEVLAALRISRASLYNLMRDGKIKPVEGTPALKRPRLQFRRADVERLLQRG